MTEDDRSVTGREFWGMQTVLQMKLFEVPHTPTSVPVGKKARSWRDYELLELLPFVAIHVGAVAGLIFFEVSWQVWALCIGLYFARMFGVVAGYHRYFSHRTYKMGRVMQFLMAFLAETSSQRGVLWWAAHHRDHHKYSDTPQDVHSPVKHGFWHAHMGWLYDHNGTTNWGRVKDLARYPELVALDKLWLLPPTLLGVACYLAYGWAGLFVGFMLSTVLVWHGTFFINSMAHVWGSRRYKTTDDSRNNFWLALITLGEGWHNNHHHFMNSTRQGFFWWEVDIAYYILKAMSWVGLVSDLKEPPARVYEPQTEDPAYVPEPAEERRAA